MKVDKVVVFWIGLFVFGYLAVIVLSGLAWLAPETEYSEFTPIIIKNMKINGVSLPADAVFEGGSHGPPLMQDSWFNVAFSCSFPDIDDTEDVQKIEKEVRQLLQLNEEFLFGVYPTRESEYWDSLNYSFTWERGETFINFAIREGRLFVDFMNYG